MGERSSLFCHSNRDKENKFYNIDDSMKLEHFRDQLVRNDGWSQPSRRRRRKTADPSPSQVLCFCVTNFADKYANVWPRQAFKTLPKCSELEFTRVKTFQVVL
jgi:hypothetical protein